MIKNIYERPEHRNVCIDGGFWKEQLDKIHNITVFDVLDKFEHDHEEGIMHNYEMVIGGETGRHVDPPWYDGLICETIRGISDIISHNYDKSIDEKIERYSQIISDAQDKSEDGYINTYVTLICPDKKWGRDGGNLIWQHELYDLGCLIEAGIHYYKATKKTLLLKCSVKAANCMCANIGYPPKMNIVPAHSLGEEAVIKLYRLFANDPLLLEMMKTEYSLEIRPHEYLNLAQFWTDHRGVHHNRASMPKYMGEYAQDHCRVTEQSEAVGHAVRAALMYTGLAALGIETAEEKYLLAAKRIWDNIVETKLHISGGIGAVHNEERFGIQYDLPNNAYLETCAGVALMFFAGEMHRAFGEADYMDVFERALYNNVLPCLSYDGTHYFYENPLVSGPDRERWSWHGCPCCPPMFLKLMGSLPDYIYSKKDDSLYVNLFIGSTLCETVKGCEVTVKQKDCAFPIYGKSSLVIALKGKLLFDINIRVPEWAESICFKINGEAAGYVLRDGYAHFCREWNDGDVIGIEMELLPKKIQAHPYVHSNTGRVALMRGPLLYCAEGTDNGGTAEIEIGTGKITAEEADLFGRNIILKGETPEGNRFTLIPYYLWCNRGKNEMAVWLRQKDKRIDINDWENRLYKVY